MSNSPDFFRSTDECVEAHKELVYKLAGRFRTIAAKHGFSVEELRQQGFEALITACRGFDPSRGVKLKTYASKIIKIALANLITPPSQVPEDPKIFRNVKRAERRLTIKLDRPPTMEEIAFEANVDLGIVRNCLEGLVLVSGDAPVAYEDDGEGESFFNAKLESKRDDHDELKVSEDNVKLLSLLESIIERSGLTPEENLVLRYRWGIDQGLKPRPRALVADMLAEQHTDGKYVVTGEKRRVAGGRPEYLTDKIRALELQATRKVGAAFRRWKSSEGGRLEL
jgi:RNA polymerase sigma factor (sigma-70 family)